MKHSAAHYASALIMLSLAVVTACTKEQPPPPPPPPPQPAQCLGVVQTSCFPPFMPAPGSATLPGQPGAYNQQGCVPGPQLGNGCNGLMALSEPQLGPMGCCYTVCVGAPLPSCAGAPRLF